MLEIKVNGLKDIVGELNKIHNTVKDTTITISNDAPYASFVGSKLKQARAHRNRWATDEDSLSAETTNIIKDFFDAINNNNSFKTTGKKAGERVVERMATYPAPRGNYVRTLRYKKSWRVEVK